MGRRAQRVPSSRWPTSEGGGGGGGWGAGGLGSTGCLGFRFVFFNRLKIAHRFVGFRYVDLRSWGFVDAFNPPRLEVWGV